MARAQLVFHFVTAVWGQPFIDRFLDVAVPNQLLPGNLGAFGGTDAVYRIFTSNEDEGRIRASAAFGRLASLMPTEIEVIGGSQLAAHKWEAMSVCHRRALATAPDDRDAIVFLSPDLVLSNGSLQAVRRVAEEGKRLLTIQTLPVLEDEFMRAYEQRGFAGLDAARAPSGRDLVSISMTALHPIVEALRWDSGGFPHYLPTLLFKVGTDGLLVRTIQPHPMMVRPHDRTLDVRHTIDDDYILSVCSDDEICAFEDSDEFLGCTLEDNPGYGFPLELERPSMTRYALWLGAQPQGRLRFLRSTYRFHASEGTDEWDEAERRLEELVATLLGRNRLLRPAAPIVAQLRAARGQLRRLRRIARVDRGGLAL